MKYEKAIVIDGFKLKTKTIVVEGRAWATAVVTGLVLRSQWFEFEPLPDDEYLITVKVENTGLLDLLISQ